MENRLKALNKALKENEDPIDSVHFTQGWNIWPQWYECSTISWRLGFYARKEYEKRENG